MRSSIGGARPPARPSPANPGGTGDVIIDANDQVDYVPFLTNGIDTQPTIRGFQPSIADSDYQDRYARSGRARDRR